MMVAAGTKNPAKVEGIMRAFVRYFPGATFKTVDAGGVTRAQPLGLDQMVQGAVARARFARSKLRADFGVGVEAGIFQIGKAYFDHQQAAVVDRRGRVSLGHSAGYQLPGGAVRRMIKEGTELERYAETLSGVKAVGDKGGLVDYLTNGAVTRAQLTEQCVVMALAPRLHRKVYGF